ncbi:MAG: GGDEF domain-containing protein [Paraglaciecola sp.]|uniref:GGDEF domain-containing protein n=1 Tax=Paraglaciecola sp. TaxID=1920173 RepID=UPI00329A74DF
MILNKASVRIPLVRVFSLALSIILVLFLLLSGLTFSKLLNFESVLKSFSNNAMPKIVLSNKLYSEAARLLEYTSLLSTSYSDAAKRLATTQLSEQVAKIRTLSSSNAKDEFLDTQLDVISMELFEFSELIQERSHINVTLTANEELVHKLYIKAKSFKSNNNSSWEADLSQSIITLDRALTSKRLRETRSLFMLIETQLNKLYSMPFSLGNSVARQKLTIELKNLVFRNNGIEELVIANLKLMGRVIGRENFLHHLINDYTQLLELNAKVIETDTSIKILKSVKEIQKQINIVGIIFINAIIILFLISLFMQRKILKRLLLVNQMVQNRIHGKNHKVIINGNDEITDLAETFEAFTKTIEQQKQELKHMSMSDSLTGIANRRAMDLRLQHDIELSVRQKSSVALLLMDIDFFKLYNDNYGHAAGDECLKLVANILTGVMKRKGDFVARYGGEEFVCVLPGTNADNARDLSTDIINKLAQADIPHEYSDVAKHITFSIGIAISNAEQVLMPETIIKQADKALYSAKNSGKNCFKLYSNAIESN